MEHCNKAISIKNKKLEFLIRYALDKPDGEITILDLRKIKILATMINHGSIWDDEIDPNYGDYEQRIEDEILKNGNRDALKLYTNFNGGKEKYRKIFSFCFLLGLTNLYDIGCGTDLQVGSIVKYKDISYTGIDCFDSFKTDKSEQVILPENSVNNQISQGIPHNIYNQLFEGYNDRIRFYKGKYPLKIQAPEDAIAILIGWYPDVRSNLPQTLGKDFNRILVQVELSNISMWQKVLEQYELYSVYTETWENFFTGKTKGYTYLYASKYREDIEHLKKVCYDYNDPRFTLGTMGKFGSNIKKH